MRPTWCRAHTNQRGASCDFSPAGAEEGVSLSYKSFSRSDRHLPNSSHGPRSAPAHLDTHFLVFGYGLTWGQAWGSLGVGYGSERSAKWVDRAGMSPTTKTVRRRKVSVDLICPRTQSPLNGFRSCAFLLIRISYPVASPEKDCQRVTFRCLTAVTRPLDPLS